jgi:hypothetical protein
MSGEAKVILAVIVLIVFISIALILLAVGRHWEDGHVRPRGGGGLHDRQCQCDCAGKVQALADYVAKLEARTHALELPEVKALIEAASNVLDYGIVLGELKYKKALAAALDRIAELQKSDA